MKQIKTVTLLLIFFFFFQYSFSETALKDSINLNEVVVTGSKTQISNKIVPVSVSKVSAAEIESTGAENVLTALNYYVPGFFVTQRNIFGFGVSTGAAGAISMRGISSNPNTSVLILIDGHPQYQGIFGHPLADAYVSSDIQKVEVIRGPASILYGSNAMAGVINLISKDQKTDGVKGTLGASYGSYNTQKYYGTIGYKKNGFSVFASVNHDQTDGIRPNTDFHINNGYLKAGYEINEHFNLNADINLAKYIANDNGPVYAPDSFNINILRGEASLSLNNKFGKADGALKIYHNFGEHTLSDGFHSTDRNSGLMLYETFRHFKNNLLTVGTDLKQYGGISNQGMNPANVNQLKTINDAALYAYTQQKFFEKLSVSAGLRFENNSVYGNMLVPMGGLTYLLNPNTSFKASVSKGFRDPTVMELYLFVPNPSLKPEDMMNYEISWLQSCLNEKLSFQLTGFYINAKDMIQVTGQYPNISRQNVGAFQNAGIEFSGKYDITKQLFLQGNYSYVHFSKLMLAAPGQQANLSLNYHYKIWRGTLSAQHISDLYTVLGTMPGTVASKQSYTLVNARIAARPMPHLEVFAMGNNLLNQQYEINDGYPMPGINFNAGVKLNF